MLCAKPFLLAPAHRSRVGLKNILGSGLHVASRLPGGRWSAVPRAALPRDSPHPGSSSSGTSHEQEPLDDDTRRRRLRFGDRPSHKWRRPRKPSEPSLLRQLLSLESPADVAAWLAGCWQQLANRAADLMGRKVYDYFNWRQDTSKDLVVTFGIFSTLLLVAGMTRRWAVDNTSERAAGGLWADVYQVCQWVFGQEFPGPDAPLDQQVFAVGTAVVGLAAFAMVLALVEQVVLEGLEANVKRGSKVFESGHILVLGWCVSQRDVEVVRKVVQQICVAHGPEGGTTIVVLTQRSKLEMERMFWNSLPTSKRYGTKLVFRQGSPLVPSDLKLVGACKAASTIIVSDQSRSAAEADAQAVRCAILLDELDSCDGHQNGSPLSYMTAMASAATNDEEELLATQLDLSLLGRHVVVELKTANALPLLKYACSSRIMALPTSQLNAQRLAKMVKRPVISIVSQQLFNFENGVSIFVHYYPHLVGTRFGELAHLFPDGIVMGLVDRATGKARMAPHSDYIVQPAHALVICRPTNVSSSSYAPLAAPASKEQLPMQDPAAGSWVAQPGRALFGNAQLTASNVVAARDLAASSSGSMALASDAGLQYKEALVEVQLWNSAVSQVELLRQQAAASGSTPDQPGTFDSDGSSNPMQMDSAASNNIVPAPSPRSHAHKVKVPSGLAAASMAFRTAQELQVPATTTSSSSQNTSRNGSRPLSPRDPGSSMLSGSAGAIIGADTSSTGTSVSITTVGVFAAADSSSSRRRPEMSSAPALAGGSDRSAGDDSSTSSSKGAAVRTVDWPVLSGTRTNASSTHLWQLINPSGRHHASLTHRLAHRTAANSVAGLSAAASGVGSRLLMKGQKAGRSNRAGGLNDAAVLVPPEYLEVDETAEKVCVLGWGPNSLMIDLLKELDHGLSALPEGSEVVFVNMHSPHDSLGQVLQQVTLDNIKVQHTTANPLQRSSLAHALDIASFKCALVLCDELWVDPDNNDANGLDSLDEPSVLRLDSLVMVAQLNVRKLLEDNKLPAINIICQKVATEGLTRFEDRHRLPLGISVNLNSFAAKMLAQIAANPLMLAPVTRLGEDAQLTIVDTSCYAALGESCNFWQLLARCQLVGDVLLGYYEIPEHLDEPLNTVVDPIGQEARSTPRVWNKGDGRVKFIVLRHKAHNHGSTSGSHDDMELENTKQAGWVAFRERNTPFATALNTPHHSHLE